MKAYIYSITNKVNGKQYIGQTINFEIRKQKHLSLLRLNKHHSKELQRAYNKYGENSFEWEYKIIEIDNQETLDLMEIKEIEKANSYLNGYNETLGGEGHKTYFNLEDSILLYQILNRYEGVGRKIAAYYGCDHSVINNLKKNILFDKCSYSEEELQKIILKLNLEDKNLKENYVKHNEKKLDKNKCFEILSIILYETGYDKTLCEIFQINSKLIYRLKKHLIYKDYIDEFLNKNEQEKKEIQEKTFEKYNIKNKKASRQRNGVANSLSQEQINYILDNQNIKKRVQIANDLGISADRVGSVILGKSYKDLVANYYSSKN